MTPQTAPNTQIAWRRIADDWRGRPVLAALLVTTIQGVVYLMFPFDLLPHDIGWITGAIATAVSFIAVGWCLRWPVPAALLILACVVFSFVSTGPAVVAVVAVALRRRPWEVACVGITWIAVAALQILRPLLRPEIERGDWWPVALVALLLLATAVYCACVAVGWYIGSRAARIAALQARAEASERKQAERIEQARAAERTQIAREMHDVLAHRMSLVAIHSGALAYRTDLTPEQVRVAATTVQESAHLALAELREVLGVLRDTAVEPGAPDRPQPTLAALADLLAETREAGTPVTLAVEEATTDLLPALGASTSRHAYRIVQESLTNARKHAPGAAVDVEITGTPGERLEIGVHNAVSPAALVPDAVPGLGLVGLAERAALAGGALVAGTEPTGDGARFVVRAWLPWTI